MRISRVVVLRLFIVLRDGFRGLFRRLLFGVIFFLFKFLAWLYDLNLGYLCVMKYNN